MKILASDFDNTLFFAQNNKKTMANIKAIERFIKQGNIFCLITGRSYMEIEKELATLKVPYTYLICADGAQIFDKTTKLLKMVPLEEKFVLRSVEILKENGYEPKLEDGFKFTNDSANCIKVYTKYDTKEHALEVVKKILAEVDVYCYASREHININNKKNDKEQALIRLCLLENLNTKNVYAIGDEVNDYEMLKSFNGAVVKDHHAALEELNLPQYDTLKDFIEELMQ